MLAATDGVDFIVSFDCKLLRESSTCLLSHHSLGVNTFSVISNGPDSTSTTYRDRVEILCVFQEGPAGSNWFIVVWSTSSVIKVVVGV